jgi:hypothetical protein
MKKKTKNYFSKIQVLLASLRAIIPKYRLITN